MSHGLSVVLRILPDILLGISNSKRKNAVLGYTARSKVTSAVSMKIPG